MRALHRALMAVTLALPPSACTVEAIDAFIAAHGVTECSTGTTGASTTTGTSAGGESSGPDSLPGSHGAEATSTGADSTSTSDLDPVTSSETTTTTDAPVCGDGVVDGDEECDDMNDIEQDGCRSDCTREWYVFITSLPDDLGNALKGADIKGIIGADYQCRHRAALLFLPNAERYMAWISTSDVQPVDRLHHARGPYKLVNGLRVAASWDALTTGPLEHPINVDELGQSVHYVAWTGTLPDGTRAPNSTHCDDWTDNDNSAVLGDADAIDQTWTHGAVADCSVEALLYCFEQP